MKVKKELLLCTDFILLYDEQFKTQILADDDRYRWKCLLNR